MSSQIEIAITKSMETAFVSTMRDTAKQLSEKFGFSYEDALKALEIDSSKPSTMVTLVKPSKKVKETNEHVTSRELKFPLPFSGRIVDDCCLAVLNNSGLYSQCLNPPSSKSDQNLCSKCVKQAQSSPDRRPPYGFISERIEQGDEYVDKKGNRPVPFTKVMKKFKLTRDMIETEVSRLDIFFDTNHFDEPESKRGRPKKNDLLVKSKKASKNITVETHEDMSSLSGSEEDDSESKKAAKKAQKQAELAEKEQRKAEKEAQKKLKEEADELEKEQKKAEKEAQKKLKEEADELEKQQKEEARKAKEVEKEAQKKAAKEAEDALRQAKETARKIKEDAENAKKAVKENRMMGKEDGHSKKVEKATKKKAKEVKTTEKKEETIVAEAEEELKNEDECEDDHDQQEPTWQFAIPPKKQTDVVIDDVVYVYQNGNIFQKTDGNKYMGTYCLNSKVVQWDNDDDEEIDEDEDSIVASQSEDDDDA